MRLRGLFYDGQTSNSLPVILELDENGQLIFDPPVLPAQAFSDVRISSRVGNTPRTLHFSSGAMLKTDNHACVDNWLKTTGQKRGLLHTLESHPRYVFGSLLALVLFVTWASIWGIPWLSKTAANAMSADMSSYIASGTLETLDARVFKPTELEKDRQDELREQFQTLLPAAPQAYDYQLVIRKGGYIGANAFALPDGSIVITDELIRLAENDEEIHSVLLHEIGHVEYKHSLRMLISHTILAALVSTLTGDFSSAGSLVLAMPNVLLDSSYSRELEWEADTYAMNYMQEHQMPLSHFADFLARLEENPFAAYDSEDTLEDCPVPPPEEETDIAVTESEPATETTINTEEEYSGGWWHYLSSHPATADRIARFRGEKPAE